ncbi:MAG: YraN family protein [Odoribacter sp.]
MAEHNKLGKVGEWKAAIYLEQQGYIILERNWRCKHLELDIICKKDQLLVIVEVKTRNLPEERPEELLDFRKRKNLRMAADAYVKLKDIHCEVRFDLILIVASPFSIRHIQEALQIFE